MTAIFRDGANVDDALRLARGFQAASVWGDADLDDEAIESMLDGLTASETGYLEVSKSGGIGGMVYPLWFAPKWPTAVELFWYSESPGEGRALRKNFEAWARERGARSAQFSCMPTREAALRRMYERAGFETVEISFRKAL